MLWKMEGEAGGEKEVGKRGMEGKPEEERGREIDEEGGAGSPGSASGSSPAPWPAARAGQEASACAMVVTSTVPEELRELVRDGFAS